MRPILLNMMRMICDSPGIMKGIHYGSHGASPQAWQKSSQSAFAKIPELLVPQDHRFPGGMVGGSKVRRKSG